MPLLASPRTDPDVPNSGIRLLPWVFDGETLTRPGVKDLGSGEIVVGQLLDPIPCRAVLLTAVPERAPPEAGDLVPEGRECPNVRGRPIEYNKHFMRFVSAYCEYINK